MKTSRDMNLIFEVYFSASPRMLLLLMTVAHRGATLIGDRGRQANASCVLDVTRAHSFSLVSI